MWVQDRKNIIVRKKKMKKIKLNNTSEFKDAVGGYDLDPTQKYIIDLEEELEYQGAILNAFQIMGPPPAIKNYHA